MGYCNATDVAVLLGLSEFSSTTQPSLDNVNDLIIQVTAEIDVILASCNITSISNANVLNLLRLNATKGVAGLVGLTYFMNNAGVENTQAVIYYRDYQEFLKQLIKSPELVSVNEGATSIMFGNAVTDGYITEKEAKEYFLDTGDFNY